MTADAPAWLWDGRRIAQHVAARLPSAVPSGALAGTAQRLAGGLLNMVWRVPTAHGSVIAKVVPPFVASQPTVPLSGSRLHAEARALAALAPGGTLGGVSSGTTSVPCLLDVDAARSVLLMEDAGPRPDLGAWLATATADEAQEAGAALGRFTGRLHASTLSHSGLDAFANPDVQATRLEVQYRAVGSWLAARSVPEAETLGAQAAELGQRWCRPGRCVVMGDLWPPSVLVAPDGTLTVIDWELSTLGEPAQDLGHLAAHLWLRDRLDVWAAFLDGYQRGAGAALPGLLANGTAEDAARHAACEVLARTVGSFSEGTGDRDRVVAHAVAWLRTPHHDGVFRALHEG